jgi:ketosteroid isomerase-like protein
MEDGGLAVMSNDPSSKEIAETFLNNLWTDPELSRSVCTEDVTWVTTRGMPIPGTDGIEHVGWDAVQWVATSGLRSETGYIPETMEYPVSEFFNVEGGHAIWRFTMKCKTKAGMDYTNDYLFFIELRDGKVARFQEYWDSKQAFDLLVKPGLKAASKGKAG